MSKIPAHATCVFKGEIFSIYQWPQQLFDGSTATFEMAKRNDTAIVIALSGDTVFYAEQEQPHKPLFTSLLGGRVEEGEDPLIAAKRELLEEAGLASDTWEFLLKHEWPGKIEWTSFVYIARDCKQVTTQKLDAGEKLSVRQTSIEHFVRSILPSENFGSKELRASIMNAFNHAAADQLIEKLKSPAASVR